MENSSERPVLKITHRARRFIELTLTDIVRQPGLEGMVAVLSFPLWVAHKDHLQAKRTKGTHDGQLVSLGLIKRKDLLAEPIFKVGDIEVAVRYTPEMLKSPEIVIDFEQELFVKP